MESINDLDEVKILGYFETVRSAFLTKLILLVSAVSVKDGKPFIDETKIARDAIAAIEKEFPDPLAYKALAKGNEELYHNVRDDCFTALFSASWNVFEQVTKDLVKPNYATQSEELSVSYQNNRFQFDKREKKDIELFYYIRNALYHYNGAYHSVADIRHRYAGVDFESIGHHGEKIDLNPMLTWRIAGDLEKYTLKAWQKAKSFGAP